MSLVKDTKEDYIIEFTNVGIQPSLDALPEKKVSYLEVEGGRIYLTETWFYGTYTSSTCFVPNPITVGIMPHTEPDISPKRKPYF